MTQSRNTIIVWSAKALLVLITLLSVGIAPAFAQEFVVPTVEPAQDFTLVEQPAEQVTTPVTTGGFLSEWGPWLLAALVFVAVISLLMRLRNANANNGDDTTTREDEPAHGPRRPTPPADRGGAHAILPFILAAAGTLGFASVATAQTITSVNPATMVQGGYVQKFTLTVTRPCEPQRLLTSQPADAVIMTAGTLNRQGDTITFGARATDKAQESVTEVRIVCKDGSTLSTGTTPLLAVVPASANYIGYQANQRLLNELKTRDERIAELRRELTRVASANTAVRRDITTINGKVDGIPATYLTKAELDAKLAEIKTATGMLIAEYESRIVALEAANEANVDTTDRHTAAIADLTGRVTGVEDGLGEVTDKFSILLEMLKDTKVRGFLGLKKNELLDRKDPRWAQLEDLASLEEVRRLYKKK